MERTGPDASQLAVALASIVARCSAGAAGVAGLRRLTGGASLETWAFDAVGAGASAPLILRRRGDDAESMETSIPLRTEAALIRAAAQAGVPVPAVVHVCAPDDGIGDGYVMTRVGGEALGQRIVRDAAFAPARALLGRQCGEALARIHAMPVPPDARLEPMDAGTVLARYEAIWRKGDAVRPTIEAAFRWLERETPGSVPPVLVHGDFRNGNLIVDPNAGLAAVLDWELAHCGDPAEDLGWLCVKSWRFGRPQQPVGGFAELETLLDGYAAAGGTPPPVSRIRYWQALGSLKWAVITAMMYRSWANGSNPAVERAVIGRRLSECEADLLALMRTGL